MTTLPARPVRFGISLLNRAVLFGVPPGVFLETAERAEAAGFFDSAWVGENLGSPKSVSCLPSRAAGRITSEAVPYVRLSVGS